MAVSTKIIGRTTLPDGRILEYGERDPLTGQRFERVLQAPTTTSAPAELPPLPSTSPLATMPQTAPTTTPTFETIQQQLQKIATQVPGITQQVQSLTAPTTPTTPTAPVTPQPIQTPQTEELKTKIEETKAQIKELTQAKELVEKGYTVTSPTETPTAPTTPTAEMPDWLKGLSETFTTQTKEAYQPLIEAYQNLPAQMKTVMQPLTDALTAYPDKVKDIYSTVVQGYTDVAEAIKNRPSMVDEYNRLMTEAKIPEAQEELARLTSKANAIEEQIEALPADVKARVQNFLMTQSSFERITAAEAEPLTKLYNAIARAKEASAADITARKQDVITVLGLWQQDINKTEEVLKWALEGKKDLASLEASLLEKGIEYYKIPAELGMKALEAQMEGLGVSTEMQAKMAEMELQVGLKGAELAGKAPETIGNADVGFWSWDTESGTFKQVVAPGATSISTPTSYQEFQLAGGQAGVGMSYAEWLTRKETVDEPLNVLDIGRYIDLYPDAGIVAGDTKKIAEQKIYNTYVTPQIFQQFKDAGYTKEQVEELWKKENDMDIIPPEVQAIIDQVYKKSFWSFLPWVD